MSETKLIVTNENYLKGKIDEFTKSIYGDDEEITVEMLAELLAASLPEVIMFIAQQNYIRGYESAYIEMEQIENTLNESKY